MPNLMSLLNPSWAVRGDGSKWGGPTSSNPSKLVNIFNELLPTCQHIKILSSAFGRQLTIHFGITSCDEQVMIVFRMYTFYCEKFAQDAPFLYARWEAEKMMAESENVVTNNIFLFLFQKHVKVCHVGYQWNYHEILG